MEKISILKTQYHILLESLILYGDYSNTPQISTIRLILDKLDKCKNIDDLEEIRKINDSLYPPRGGLGEFYIWDNDYDKRMLLNEPIDKAKDITWNILNTDL
ncbi:hypothetical protein ATZ33_13775 [Enterococcus silesiacus]|uniref:Uncharacterized protein n=1 Tax=Enterococcus silesiacus TaxID=332949 RepID=A0A0S3KDN1_9ENTE|nr:hypothetical protein [Enterococcus silesiacus]ALS02416.1 hypothetical protein ATZ33_13775 [Enterococcus silesiacus]OJG88187.1 hypothetical protein RV15_GL001846 [Enterococcus silesiacus]